MKKNIYLTKYNQTLNYDNTKKEFNLYNNYFYRNYKNYLPSDRSANILDIGCGNGIFLRFLKKMNFYNSEGFDLSIENVEECKKFGLSVDFGDAFEYLSQNNKKYSVIVLNDVIEHIPKNEVVDKMQLLKSHLEDGGYVIVKTLNMSNPISVNTLYCDFTHEYGYTEKNIVQVFSLAGFNNCEVHETIVYFDFLAVDFILPAIYFLNNFFYRIKYLYNGKKGYHVFSKNLICIAHK